MLALQVKAECEGVREFGFVDSVEEPHFFTFKISCGNCHEVHPNAVGFNAHETVAIPNSRGEANFSMKCKSCGKDGNITFEPRFGTYVVEEGKKKPVVMAKFECRGLELVSFLPDGQFWAKGEDSNTKFAVSFDDNEWYDYDEKAAQEVSITCMDWTIVKTK